ncbi:MAG TPA: hypothetical protein VFN03_05205 [Trueperaceae bacterium]|nr:hypothetical protein [Trueperaceae bacterium]
MRDIVGIDEMRVTEAIQREVWGLADVDIVPAAQLKAAVHAGGQLAGAFADESMIGFAYGLVARPHGPGMEGVGLHSHMVAVREQGRQRGVGRALKWFQRQWCLERSMPWITWTFDPLQSRNANLNFEHLGVVSHEYLVDFYGVMAGPLGSNASDRLVALWLLDSEPVRRRASEWSTAAHAGSRDVRDAAASPGEAVARREAAAEPRAQKERVVLDDAGAVADLWVLREEDVVSASSPLVTDRKGADTVLGRDQEFRDALADTTRRIALRVAVPPDVGSLKRSQPDLIDSWRSGIRATIIPALAAGFTVVGFSEGAYLLERRPLVESQS